MRGSSCLRPSALMSGAASASMAVHAWGESGIVSRCMARAGSGKQLAAASSAVAARRSALHMRVRARARGCGAARRSPMTISTFLMPPMAPCCGLGPLPSAALLLGCEAGRGGGELRQARGGTAAALCGGCRGRRGSWVRHCTFRTGGNVLRAARMAVAGARGAGRADGGRGSGSAAGGGARRTPLAERARAGSFGPVAAPRPDPVLKQPVSSSPSP